MSLCRASAWYEQWAEALEGCQWRRSSQVELFELGFWFWLCELGKGARLAGLARVGVGGGAGGYRHSHQVAASCCVGGEKTQQPPVMVMAEAPKAVQAKGVAPPVENVVQPVEKVKAPQPEPEAQEEEEQEEYDVEELLTQHQDLVDSMLAEVMLGSV